MCVTSMVGDHYRDKYVRDFPWVQPNTIITLPPAISREEFDALKRDVQEMKELLVRAKKYDEENNEPECEVEDKMKLLRQIAELVGVNLDEVIGASKR